MGKEMTAKKSTTETTDIDYAEQAVPKESRKGFVSMFMIMLGFTFFSASMWVGQQLAEGLDFWGFLGSLILGGAILGAYTGLLGYVGAKTGLSMDLLAKKAFGEKGSWLSSAMISFTQIGWFGVGLAMFAIPVAGEIFHGNEAAKWILVVVAGVCMTASAYFGIKSLTLVSSIAVPLVAVLGTVAMVMAVRQGDGSLQRVLKRHRRRRSCHRLLRIGRNGHTELHTLCQGCEVRHDRYGDCVFHRKLADVLLRSHRLYLCGWK